MKYEHRMPVNKRKFRRLFSIIGLVLLGLVLAGWLVAEQWYRSNLRPVSEQGNEVVFAITLGTSTADVAESLEEQALIRSSRAFIWYINRLDGTPVLQAGTYRLNAALTLPEIADIIINGQVDTSLVTIPPGLRLDQIKDALERAGFKAEDIDLALKKRYDHPLMVYLPDDATLEGYIYPETFKIDGSSAVADTIERSFDVFYEQLSDPILRGLKRQKLSVHQAIILASIIEKEVTDPEVQRQVAQVFLKRLKEGIPLGADPTFRYAAALLDVEATPDVDSPYNTRIHAGLPPGPIANFNISALEAVANPADTDHLYFVSGDDGQTYFAKTEAEHQANVNKYCHELCRL